MSLSAAVIDALVDAGATVVQLAAAVKADLAEGDARAKLKREKDAARQRKSRMSRGVTVTARDTADAPPNDNISNPPAPSEPKGSTGAKRVRAQSIFELPEWVPAEPWAAFEKMRKGMRGVPFGDDAKRGIVGDLDKLRGEGHDPAKLLLKAVKLGWRGIFGGDDTKSAFQRAAKPWTAADLRRAIAYAEDNNDPERAAEYRARLEAVEQPRRATGPPGRSIGEIVQKAQLSH